MEDRIKKILDSLIIGTSNGKLSWQGTDRNDEYSLKLDKGAITVDSWESYDDESEEQYSLVDIAFLNSLGEPVERVVFSRDDDFNDYRRLFELHKLAKRSHLQIDETLDDMLGEIERKIR